MTLQSDSVYGIFLILADLVLLGFTMFNSNWLMILALFLLTVESTSYLSDLGIKYKEAIK